MTGTPSDAAGRLDVLARPRHVVGAARDEVAEALGADADRAHHDVPDAERLEERQHPLLDGVAGPDNVPALAELTPTDIDLAQLESLDETVALLTKVGLI